MNILMVYPEYPDTFWSFKHALKFISKKASFPPLGLLTIAAMLPVEWNKKLVDLNVAPLTDRDILWADLVFISAMSVQRKSAESIIARCRKLGAKVVAGGPLFTSEYQSFVNVDHFILNEGEITIPQFVEDLKTGHLKPVYSTGLWADITTTPAPLWELIDMNKYATMNLQYSRGCPYNCEFCDITVLFGRVPRMKTKEQLLSELDILYNQGWRGGVFFVDDNFIGNKVKLKKEILPAIIAWMEQKNRPFSFITEVSIDFSDDEELMSLMIKAGFDTVFIGIETPNQDSLVECNKYQNKNRDLLACIKKIQHNGLQVQAGFIVGFDSDPLSIFDRITGFIQESGIVSAMVGLLNAPRGTKLYQRLAKEGRILKDMSGDNTDFSINFIPKMDYNALIEGYKKIIGTIYSPKHYYERVKVFLKEYRPFAKQTVKINLNSIAALFKSMVYLGIIGKERVHYWKLFLWSLFKKPRLFPLAIMLSIYGFHYRKTFEGYS
ncbi:MAG: DUF4070 domain-containing protein [Clostridiales bacterium]|jgi:radical SAM superfamily enzyme YgiQ (UPF0313 family)|nr:DUF4070 domain-containing protein [Eubacteriales bacterium]MDH7565101.1 DUF4070 domain-containing protein [Clostridiales bacterium]